MHALHACSVEYTLVKHTKGAGHGALYSEEQADYIVSLACTAGSCALGLGFISGKGYLA